MSQPISISGKQWRFPPEANLDAGLIEAAEGSSLLGKLLVRRNIKSAAQARAYLSPSEYVPTSPMELPDMARVIIRLAEAVAHGHHITVYGDYDVDGITATAVLFSVLTQLGASVDYYIPQRAEEGYGLNLKAVSVLASKHQTKLIITCDCGIANFAEINFARSLGVDTIVVDHHNMPEVLPPAVAILHPKQLSSEHPLFELSGVGVAYKLCEALLIDRGMSDKVEGLLDLVVLGLIADMVPLVKENRYLVQLGLPKLMESPRPGIGALLAQAKNSTGTELVGFRLAPAINAVGRLADARIAVELLTTNDSATATTLARQLQLENARRQQLCEKITTEAEQMVSTTVDLTAERAIVICKQGWHHGVVGIVASRLMEKYHRPVLVAELDTSEGLIKGSARSVESLDLHAVLKANEKLLVKWGGHKMAAGFSLQVDKWDVFKSAILNTCEGMLEGKDIAPVLDVDLVVKPKDVSLELANTLSKLAPFGVGNRKPVLVLSNLSCSGTQVLGKAGTHTRVMLRDPVSKIDFESVFWSSRGRVPAKGLVLDVAFTPEINVYNGYKRLQLVLTDWRQSSPEDILLSKGVDHGHTDQIANSCQEVRSSCASTPPAQQLSAQEVGSSLTIPETRAHVLRAVSQKWKDLRGHDEPEAVLMSAVRNLGSRLAVFAESVKGFAGVPLMDRTSLGHEGHLLVWQFPPSLEVFRALVARPTVESIYLVGGAGSEAVDSLLFLRRLLGLARFAVNQREGKAESDKVASALGATKVAVALGLTILRKLNAIDWFAEDGVLYLDILDQPISQAQDLPETRQLSSCLNESYQFRLWCSKSSLREIQLALAP
ncbi:MAG: single-stranded-DNA-specific exonuclease RecJ, partial [Candidatus Melainabacteria bacterium]|nr:single-stranded-DNA-specific exonuclease RecJ [Candidatus Melainabacteria bacterium]